jgi:hypothetical protein
MAVLFTVRNGWEADIRTRALERLHDNSELRKRLSAILDRADQPVVDWPAVDQLLDSSSRDLKEEGASECPHFVWHFIADRDIRSKDAVYGDNQREEVRHFVETGEYDPDWDKGTGPWGCIAAVLTIGGLTFWLM